MPKLTWLFDLDNTLHNASHAIFPAINLNMNAYIAQVLNEAGAVSDEAAVNAARVAYWQRYGATLLGMVNHHQVRPEDFLREAHRFDDLATMIRAERGLGKLLRRLPGRKILLTNAPRRYSHEVLRHLGLHKHFARHVPIEAMRVHGRLRPKPSKQMLRKLLAKEDIRAGRCVLVEDTVSHLKGAKSLGLRTAWVTQYLAADSSKGAVTGNGATVGHIKRPIYVDVKVKSVGQLFRQLHRLR
ncbi:Putative hydrolase [Herminiimonas arsenicoxydans]|uniref:Hydrolase n=1 Tax=Herminiimonas arsenicoxydans TaxID=204773 RepID=A4G9A8_HERAR|nr:Putative hydrolase [Herminiimonas arsenicoxydans]